MKLYDVTGLGELLIDFTTNGRLDGKPNYSGNPGGAPINVAAAIVRLGGSSAYLSKVGNDALGKFLIETLDDMSIESKGVKVDDVHNTTLAFVDNAPNGDRSFSFYRKYCADAFYGVEDVNDEIIVESKILQLGSLMVSTDFGYNATMHAIEIAKKNNVMISYDPNLRYNIWEHKENIIPYSEKLLSFADIVKMSETEAEAYTGVKDELESSELLLKKYPDIKLLLITLGDKGAIYRTKKLFGKVDSIKVQAIDTTGCGDAFTGGVLSGLLAINKPISKLSQDEIIKISKKGCAIGAYVATKFGGVMSMPTEEELKIFLEERK